MTAVQGTSAAIETEVPQQADQLLDRALHVPKLISLRAILELEGEAANCAQYLRTSIVSLSRLTAKDHPTRNARRLLFRPRPSVEPRVDRRQTLQAIRTDRHEIAFIESQVAEHDSDCSMRPMGRVEDE